jgi:O-antigen/teichoic acid export membrane protein
MSGTPQDGPNGAAGEGTRTPPEPTAEGAPRASIAGTALRGSVWTLGGYAFGQVVRFGSNLILTRLLFPAVFGEMALVTIFMQGLQMFSDVGIAPAIVQSHREDPRFLNTAWTIASGRGWMLWIGSWAIAAPVAAFYDQPLLKWLIPVAGFDAVLRGMESTSVHTAQRHLRLERLTLMDLGAQLVGIVATIALVLVDRAVYGPNHPGAVWSVVIGGLVGTAFRLGLSFTVLPGIRHRFVWDRVAAQSLFRFGRWVFLSSLLTFMAGQADRLVFGKMIPIALLGVYNIASMLATMPTQIIQTLGSRVLFPAYSRMAGQGDLRSVHWRARLPLLLGGGAAVTGLIACGPFLIRVLYDRRYEQAGWILQFLAAGAWFQILESTNSAALLAQGRVTWMAAGSATKLAGMVLLLPLGFHLGGFPGALVGLLLSQLLMYAAAATGATRAGLAVIGRDLGLTLAMAVVAGTGYLAGHAAAGRLHANLAGLAGAMAVMAAAWVPVGVWYLKRERAFDAVRRRFSRPTG